MVLSLAVLFNFVMALHIETPLIESTPLSTLTSCKVLLKLENCQPAASFKIRGIGALCSEVSEKLVMTLHLLYIVVRAWKSTGLSLSTKRVEFSGFVFVDLLYKGYLSNLKYIIPNSIVSGYPCHFVPYNIFIEGFKQGTFIFI